MKHQITYGKLPLPRSDAEQADLIATVESFGLTRNGGHTFDLFTREHH